jgi:hypothetical protein
VIIEMGITNRRQKSILDSSNSKTACFVVTARTVNPSRNNSAARISIGDFRSEHDQRMLVCKMRIRNYSVGLYHKSRYLLFLSPLNPFNGLPLQSRGLRNRRYRNVGFLPRYLLPSSCIWA